LFLIAGGKNYKNCIWTFVKEVSKLLREEELGKKADAFLQEVYFKYFYPF
jgi:hypothetical protein